MGQQQTRGAQGGGRGRLSEPESKWHSDYVGEIKRLEQSVKDVCKDVTSGVEKVRVVCQKTSIAVRTAIIVRFVVICLASYFYYEQQSVRIPSGSHPSSASSFSSSSSEVMELNSLAPQIEEMSILTFSTVLRFILLGVEVLATLQMKNNLASWTFSSLRDNSSGIRNDAITTNSEPQQPPQHENSLECEERVISKYVSMTEKQPPLIIYAHLVSFFLLQPFFIVIQPLPHAIDNTFFYVAASLAFYLGYIGALLAGIVSFFTSIVSLLSFVFVKIPLFFLGSFLSVFGFLLGGLFRLFAAFAHLLYVTFNVIPNTLFYFYHAATFGGGADVGGVAATTISGASNNAASPTYSHRGTIEQKQIEGGGGGGITEEEKRKGDIVTPFLQFVSNLALQLTAPLGSFFGSSGGEEIKNNNTQQQQQPATREEVPHLSSFSSYFSWFFFFSSSAESSSAPSPRRFVSVGCCLWLVLSVLFVVSTVIIVVGVYSLAGGQFRFGREPRWLRRRGGDRGRSTQSTTPPTTTRNGVGGEMAEAPNAAAAATVASTARPSASDLLREFKLKKLTAGIKGGPLLAAFVSSQSRTVGIRRRTTNGAYCEDGKDDQLFHRRFLRMPRASLLKIDASPFTLNNDICANQKHYYYGAVLDRSGNVVEDAELGLPLPIASRAVGHQHQHPNRFRRPLSTLPDAERLRQQYSDQYYTHNNNNNNNNINNHNTTQRWGTSTSSSSSAVGFSHIRQLFRRDRAPSSTGSSTKIKTEAIFAALAMDAFVIMNVDSIYDCVDYYCLLVWVAVRLSCVRTWSQSRRNEEEESKKAESGSIRRERGSESQSAARQGILQETRRKEGPRSPPLINRDRPEEPATTRPLQTTGGRGGQNQNQNDNQSQQERGMEKVQLSYSFISAPLRYVFEKYLGVSFADRILFGCGFGKKVRVSSSAFSSSPLPNGSLIGSDEDSENGEDHPDGDDDDDEENDTFLLPSSPLLQKLGEGKAYRLAQGESPTLATAAAAHPIRGGGEVSASPTGAQAGDACGVIINACVICLANRSDVLFIPCGHVSCCVDCVRGLAIKRIEKARERVLEKRRKRKEVGEGGEEKERGKQQRRRGEESDGTVDEEACPICHAKINDVFYPAIW